MEVTKTDFPGLIIIKPHIFEDNRGYFCESYNKDQMGSGIKNIIACSSRTGKHPIAWATGNTA